MSKKVWQAISKNADRYRSPAEMLEHLHRIASCTGNRSGCFGIAFPQLLPAVEQLAVEARYWETLESHL